MEPSLSVLSVKGLNPADTDTPDPEEDPPGASGQKPSHLAHHLPRKLTESARSEETNRPWRWCLRRRETGSY